MSVSLLWGDERWKAKAVKPAPTTSHKGPLSSLHCSTQCWTETRQKSKPVMRSQRGRASPGSDWRHEVHLHMGKDWSPGWRRTWRGGGVEEREERREVLPWRSASRLHAFGGLCRALKQTRQILKLRRLDQSLIDLLRSHGLKSTSTDMPLSPTVTRN